MNAELKTQNTRRKGEPKLHNNCISRFKMIIAEDFDNVIVTALNINSVSSKFDEFNLMVNGLFEFTEAKLDDSFPEAQAGLSDFQNLVLSVFRLYLSKIKAKEIS